MKLIIEICKYLMYNDDFFFIVNIVGWFKVWWLLVMLISLKYIFIYFYFFIDVFLD